MKALATPSGSVTELVDRTPNGRNRAVDAYRVAAMVLVAIGHWVAIAASVGPDGSILAGNALEAAPALAPISWIFQVMPLFFVVGGYASAASLRAHLRRRPDRPQDWVMTRLVRMLAPTRILAMVWLAIIALTSIAGVGVGLAATAAAGAAVPLWFLANYTIDTAIAPYVLPRFQARPGRVAAIGLATFLVLEAARFADVPHIPKLNWVIGWLLFQVAGFAWFDGLLPTGRRMLAVATGLWAGAVAAVTVGPWPVPMVHVPGLDHSPTHPPSLALLLFGAAYAATAIAAAPAVSGLLTRSKRAWSVVIAANTMTMSVYLWHMSAAAAATGLFWLTGAMPSAAVGSAPWWFQKLPLITVSLLVLGAIVTGVGQVERRALLSPPAPRCYGPVRVSILAVGVSVSIEAWSLGSTLMRALAMAAVVVLWILITVPARSAAS